MAKKKLSKIEKKKIELIRELAVKANIPTTEAVRAYNDLKKAKINVTVGEMCVLLDMAKMKEVSVRLIVLTLIRIDTVKDFNKKQLEILDINIIPYQDMFDNEKVTDCYFGIHYGAIGATGEMWRKVKGNSKEIRTAIIELWEKAFLLEDTDIKLMAPIATGKSNLESIIPDHLKNKLPPKEEKHYWLQRFEGTKHFNKIEDILNEQYNNGWDYLFLYNNGGEHGIMYKRRGNIDKTK